MVNKTHTRDQICDRTNFVGWAIRIGEPRFLRNQMHLVNRGLDDLQIRKHDSRVRRVLFQGDLIQRPGACRFEPQFRFNDRLIQLQLQTHPGALQRYEIAMRLAGLLGWQARIIGVAEIFPETRDARTGYRINVEIFGHGIAREDSVFQIFVGHINIGDKLVVRHHRHSLDDRPLRNGHHFQLGRLDLPSTCFHPHGHRLIFRNDLSRRLRLDDFNLNSRDSSNIRSGQ